MSVIRQQREPGISFIIRCRNEEAYLAQNLSSLRKITIPHEILVIFHFCSDRSREIVEEYKAAGLPIKTFEYTQEISRSGYETLVTPADHPASIMTYYTFCFGKASYNWLVKWDADFVATTELIRRINALKSSYTSPTRVRIGVRLTEGIINKEDYLYNCLIGFGKHVFWETPLFVPEARQVGNAEPLIDSIPSTVLKDYWKKKPWFMRQGSYDKELAEKYRKLVEMLGPEPPGMARASNPDCDAIYWKVIQGKDSLQRLGIMLYE